MQRTVLAAIAGCFLIGTGWVAGQQQTQPYRVPIDPSIQPYILSGPDIGFRVEGKTRDGVVGALMVRLKSGEWVAVHGNPARGRVIPLDAK